MSSGDILTKRELAELLQVSERTVERWMSEGSIPYVPLPKRGTWSEARFLRSEIMNQLIETIETEVRSRPSPIEFEMAYQARVASDRIKFAIKHAEQFSRPCEAMHNVGLQLLDALQRPEAVDRRFQNRSRIVTPHKNGNPGQTVVDVGKENYE